MEKFTGSRCRDTSAFILGELHWVARRMPEALKPRKKSTQILGAGILKQSPRITVLERTPKRTNPRRAPCIRFPLPGWRRGDLIRERGGRPWRLRPSGSLESVGVLSARGQAKTATGDPGSLDRNGWHCFSISQANPYPDFQKATYNE